jgi:hypothetical protein
MKPLQGIGVKKECQLSAQSDRKVFGMKLLVLHPRLTPEDPLIRSLKATGALVFLVDTLERARQVFEAHASSLEAVIIHREPSGLSFLESLKAHPSADDLPVILTSDEWGASDFKKHQESPHGANAYLRFQDCEQELKATIEKLVGHDLSLSLAMSSVVEVDPSSASLSVSHQAQPPIEASGSGGSGSGGIVINIEDSESLYRSSELSMGSMFRLEVDEPVAAENGATRLMSLAQATPSDSAGLEITPSVGPSIQIEPAVVKPELSASPPSNEYLFSKATRVVAPEERREENIDELPETGIPHTTASAQFEQEPSGGASVAEAALPFFSDQPGSSAFSVSASSTAPGSSSIPVKSPVTGSFSRSQDEPLSELPYLLGGGRPRPSPMVGDVVIPGGAAQSPDVETLKRYLTLREQDVAVLSAQLHEARVQVRRLEEDLRQSHALMEEQSFQLDGKIKREQEFEKEKELLAQGLQAEIEELRFQMKTRADKARVLDSQVRETGQEMERLRERVRNDIRKIRVREKELDNRLEIVQKDSKALLEAREAMILELKRKLDTAEFNLDLMQDRLAREKTNSADLREKLLRASQAVRLAGGLLDPVDVHGGVNESGSRSPSYPERKVS